VQISVGLVGATLGVVVLAAFFQRISGFGFGLFATPLLALAMPVNQAVVVLTLVSMPNAVLNWREFGSHVDRAQVRRLSGWSLPAMPLGLLVGHYLSNDALTVLVSGCVIVAALLLLVRYRIKPERAVLADRIAGVVSGVLNTSTGTNGPPLVFVLNGQQLLPDRVRGSLSYVFGVSNLVAAGLFFVDGRITKRVLLLSAFAIPTVLIGRAVGAPLGNRLSTENFRRVAIVMLVAIGISGIIRALI
jgi:uncharacterized protein